MPHSNGINEPADEKDVSGETDERSDGSVGCSYTDLPQISAVWDFAEYQISFEWRRPAKENPATTPFEQGPGAMQEIQQLLKEFQISYVFKAAKSGLFGVIRGRTGTCMQSDEQDSGSGRDS